MAENMADRDRGETDSPCGGESVRGRKAAIPPSDKRVVGYFNEWGQWQYGYRDPGNWMIPGEGYDYRQ